MPLQPHAPGPVVVEVDYGSASTRGRPPDQAWLIRLRCGDRAVIITIGLRRPAAEHLADHIIEVLGPHANTPPAASAPSNTPPPSTPQTPSNSSASSSSSQAGSTPTSNTPELAYPSTAATPSTTSEPTPPDSSSAIKRTHTDP